jgi:hypothetical protein
MADNSAPASNEISTNLVHSPSTGFIDIKPLGAYTSYWKEPVSGILVLIAFGIVAYLILHSIRKNSSSHGSLLTLDPFPELESSIKELRTSNHEIRAFSEELSSSIRRFIDRSMDMTSLTKTPREALFLFSPLLKSKLPIIPKNIKVDFEDSLLAMLVSLEHSAYGNDVRRFDSSEWRQEMLSQALSWCSTLQKELEREKKRTSPVTGSGDKKTRTEASA